ncbi:hypothetical protein [Microcoleus sp. herbarium13]
MISPGRKAEKAINSEADAPIRRTNASCGALSVQNNCRGGSY